MERPLPLGRASASSSTDAALVRMAPLAADVLSYGYGIVIAFWALTTTTYYQLPQAVAMVLAYVALRIVAREVRRSLRHAPAHDRRR